MYAYPQTAAAPSRSNGMDVTAWALVALIVAIICAGVGWFAASQDVLGNGDVQTQAELASREAAAAGVQSGYKAGAAQGRREAGLQAQLKLAQTKRSAAQEGFTNGFSDGRQRAAARSNGINSTFGMTSYDSYSLDTYTDPYATGLFDDAPGYSSSAYDEFGYGLSGGSVYGSTNPLASASLGN